MIDTQDLLLVFFETLQKADAKTNAARSSSGSRMGLTSLQVSILAVVRHEPGCTMGQLSRSLTLHPPAATRLVDTLVDEGMVERFADSEDRRMIRLQLTMRGRYTSDLLQRENAMRFSKALDIMTAEEVENLIAGLQRWTEAVVSTSRQE